MDQLVHLGESDPQYNSLMAKYVDISEEILRLKKPK